MRFVDVERGYVNLFAQMTINEQAISHVRTVASNVYKNRDKYQAVQADTGVPWFWVGIIHQIESSGDFTTHLHNGDPLTDRTVNEPPNRPVNGQPPFLWHVSAADALEYKGLTSVKEWSLARCLYEAERYNGFGYFTVGINSPYLWSFSDLYQKGKYTSDHKYSGDVVSKQAGFAVILKAMGDMGMLEGWPETRRESKPKTPTKHTTKIDQVLGGDWLAGKKTIIGIVLYVAAHLIDQADLFPLITNDLVMGYFDTLITGWIGLAALSKAEKWLAMVTDVLSPKKSQA